MAVTVNAPSRRRGPKNALPVAVIQWVDNRVTSAGIPAGSGRDRPKPTYLRVILTTPILVSASRDQSPPPRTGLNRVAPQSPLEARIGGCVARRPGPRSRRARRDHPENGSSSSTCATSASSWRPPSGRSTRPSRAITHVRFGDDFSGEQTASRLGMSEGSYRATRRRPWRGSMESGLREGRGSGVSPGGGPSLVAFRFRRQKTPM